MFGSRVKFSPGSDFYTRLIVFMDLAYELGIFIRRGNTLLISSIIVISGNTSCKADDNSMYSAPAVLRAIFVCNEMREYMGQFAYMMTIPVHNITFSASLECACCQPTSKYASI